MELGRRAGGPSPTPTRRLGDGLGHVPPPPATPVSQPCGNGTLCDVPNLVRHPRPATRVSFSVTQPCSSPCWFFQIRFSAAPCKRCASGNGGRCPASSCSASRPWRGEVPPRGSGTGTTRGAPGWGQVWVKPKLDGWVFPGIPVLAAAGTSTAVLGRCHRVPASRGHLPGDSGDTWVPGAPSVVAGVTSQGGLWLTRSFPPVSTTVLCQVWTSTGCTGSAATWPPSRNCATKWSTVRSPAVTTRGKWNITPHQGQGDGAPAGEGGDGDPHPSLGLWDLPEVLPRPRR